LALLLTGSGYAVAQCPSPLPAGVDTCEQASQGHICAEDQYKNLGGPGTLGCTAKDLAATATAQVTGNQVGQCPLGQQATVDVLINLMSGSPDRYDVGLFIGENANSAIAAGGACSAAIFPTTPTGTHVSGGGWYNQDNNTCGDYNGSSTTNNLVQGVKVKCVADSTGHLLVPYAIIYRNNASGTITCTGVDDVTADNTSKCIHDDAAVINNVFVTVQADPTCSKTVSYDGTTLTTTITMTNNGAAPNNNPADGTSFKDDFTQNTPAVSLLTINCQNATGGAVCTNLQTTSGIATGTINPFPIGSSVDVVITAAFTVPVLGNPQYNNSVDLTTPGTVAPPTPPYVLNLDGTSTYTGACTAFTTLPVRLQSFDVK
jgi:hypothetical protein